MLGLKEIYSTYITSVKEPLPKELFTTLIQEFNLEVVNRLLEGEAFNMRNHLSNICIKRMQRNPSSPTVDWWESLRYKQELLQEGKELYSEDNPEGNKWFIYYTDPWYCKYHWEKHRCKIPNKSAYRFTPSRGLKGNKEKLTKLLKNNELAYLRFQTYGNQ